MSISSNNSGMELPPPLVEHVANPSLPKELDPKKAENSTAHPAEQTNLSPPTTQAVQPPTTLFPSQTPISLTTSSKSDDNDLQSAALQLVQDKDLIEKEWVNRAKSIVEDTREDPFKQSESLTMLKADYMKKQFNKTLKLDK